METVFPLQPQVLESKSSLRVSPSKLETEIPYITTEYTEHSVNSASGLPDTHRVQEPLQGGGLPAFGTEKTIINPLVLFRVFCVFRGQMLFAFTNDVMQFLPHPIGGEVVHAVEMP